MRQQSGYTLVEMLVTVSIFALAFIAIGAIFLGYSTAQSRASTAQRLLNEANFFLESIAREIRSHAVDYDCSAEMTDAYICLRSPEDSSVVQIRVTEVSGEKQIWMCRGFTETVCIS